MAIQFSIVSISLNTDKATRLASYELKNPTHFYCSCQMLYVAYWSEHIMYYNY